MTLLTTGPRGPQAFVAAMAGMGRDADGMAAPASGATEATAATRLLSPGAR